MKMTLRKRPSKSNLENYSISLSEAEYDDLLAGRVAAIEIYSQENELLHTIKTKKQFNKLKVVPRAIPSENGRFFTADFWESVQ